MTSQSDVNSVIIVQDSSSACSDKVGDEDALIEAAWKDRTGTATKILVWNFETPTACGKKNLFLLNL